MRFRTVVTVLVAALGVATLGAAKPIGRQPTALGPDPRGAGWGTEHATIPDDASPTPGSIRVIRGIATRDEATLRDGTIDLQLPAPLALGEEFAGIAFRMASTADYEIVYLQTSTDGLRWQRIQYQPVYEGETSWQLYAGDGFETELPRPAAPRAVPATTHVRLVIAGRRADVYVDDMTKPVLRIRELKREPIAGGVGVWAISPKGGWVQFDSLQVSGAVAATPTPFPPVATPAGQIMQWRLSPRLPSPDSVEPPRELSRRLHAMLDSGTVVGAEQSGLVNLAALRGNPAGKQAYNVFGGAGWGMALASVHLTSDRARTVRLRFGYSDAASVFVNGKLVYSGRNDYGYRYRTDIARLSPDAESVELPLHAGVNELVLAVTDKAFGWGLAARLDDPNVVRVDP